jgi:GntR family transcriptional regulator
MPAGGGRAAPQGVPVIRVLRTVFGTGDVLVEVPDTVAAAGRHEWRYEVSLNGDGGPGPR